MPAFTSPNNTVLWCGYVRPIHSLPGFCVPVSLSLPEANRQQCNSAQIEQIANLRQARTNKPTTPSVSVYNFLGFLKTLNCVDEDDDVFVDPEAESNKVDEIAVH